MSAYRPPDQLPALVPVVGGGAIDLGPVGRLIRAFFASRSPATLRAYARDLTDFAHWLPADDIDAAAAILMAHGGGKANELVLNYRTHLQARKLSPATINRRLAALRSLTRLGSTLGLITWRIEIQGLGSEAYRDTRGPGTEGYRGLLAQLDGKTDRRSIRDRAIVRLLYDLGLRRAEVTRLDLADYDQVRSTMMVLGKGRLEKVRLTLPPATSAAIVAWLAVRPAVASVALFVRVDRRDAGRLDGSTVYRIVRQLGEAAGIHARPHGLRHSSITRVLDLSGGNIRAAQRFSRHKDVRVLERYDDSVKDVAGELARQLAADAE
jgi:integrase/recombinase XerC